MSFAQPGDIVAAESTFARLVREQGVTEGFRAMAAPGAQQLSPGATTPTRMADAPREKGRPAPATLGWSPALVWMSCDGGYAVSSGGWQDGTAAGWYVTVWQRQKKGDYKWVLDLGGTAPAPLPEPDMVRATSAECPAKPHGKPDAPANPPRKPEKPKVEPLPDSWMSGQAKDGTLSWQAAPGRFTLSLRRDGAMQPVTVAPPVAGAQP